mgnify:CR=1 FL=1
MSEFDKEAEREKLREKYGEDDADREATQRMSQLLLQGATMTNRHCDRCGDPIFRQNDQEFCPTCNAEAQAADADAQAADAENQGADADTNAAENRPTETQSATADAQSADADARSAAAQRAPAGRQPTDAQSGRAAAPGRPEFEAPRTPPTEDAAPAADSNAASRSGGSSDLQSSASAGDLADADAALVTTLNRFASAAAQTDDPRRAKEHLEAAREAAEALDALRR